MSSGVGLVLGCLIIGIFIGIIIANTASSFSIEVTPNDTFRASVDFKSFVQS